MSRLVARFLPVAVAMLVLSVIIAGCGDVPEGPPCRGGKTRPVLLRDLVAELSASRFEDIATVPRSYLCDDTVVAIAQTILGSRSSSVEVVSCYLSPRRALLSVNLTARRGLCRTRTATCFVACRRAIHPRALV
jgi:hypothetical protein